MACFKISRALAGVRQDPVSPEGQVLFLNRGQRIFGLEPVGRLQRFASHLKSHGRPTRDGYGYCTSKRGVGQWLRGGD